MLVNCPKCGFSQPKDRYCANCGVDMEIYRPKSTPLWKKILGSPVLHVALIFAIVLTAILSIRNRQQQELKARMEYLKGGPVVVDRQQPKVEVTASAQAETKLAQATPPPTTPPAPAAENLASASAAAASAPTTLPPPPAPSADAANRVLDKKTVADKNIPRKATLIYAEVDRTVLASWGEEMRTNGQFRIFDDVAMGVLPQGVQKLKAGHGIRVLQETDQPVQTLPQNFDWFAGTHKTRELENEIGFFSSLALSEVKDGLIKGEIEVQRAFRDRESKDPVKGIERVSFGGPFELPPGAVYVMRGLLPSKYLTDVPEDANPDPVLSIFNSRSFASGQTEFTLILEFDTSSTSR